MTNRRNFIAGAFAAGAAAAAARAAGETAPAERPAAAAGRAAPPLPKVRVGVFGLGHRGPGAVHRLSAIPGTEVAALCDLVPARVDAQAKWLAENGKPAARRFAGPEAWKELCEWDGVDAVYVATDWAAHVPIALRGLENGKHAFVEVPAALTVEDCWRLVEASERTGRHCMQLENCCYGEIEMLALNLCRKGLLGRLVHAEGAYIHDLRTNCFADGAAGGYHDFWRLRENRDHAGNRYPTHGLGPLCQCLNVNRGDRLDYLVSVDSASCGFRDYAAHAFPEGDWRRAWEFRMADMNTTIVRTALGRTIMLQHDVANARPYTRLCLVSGTRGILQDYPFRCAIEPSPGAGAHAFDADAAARLRAEHQHPLWRKAGDIARKAGGHGGMDFLMDLRWSYCLQNGLPLDMDVYDLASWCSLCALTEQSATARGRSVDVPDFTRGGWKTAAPLGIVDVDLDKLGLGAAGIAKDPAALDA